MDSSNTSITALTGPPFVSLILNWGLFGALSIQVYLYCQVFPNEPLRIKLLVYSIFILESVQTLLLTMAVWKWLVSGFGQMQGLNLIGTHVWISVCVIGGIVAFLVQLFYAYRIRMFSRNPYISCLIVFMATCSFAGALGAGVDAAQSHLFTELLDHKTRIYTLIGLWSGSGSACDVVIALSMCYYLRKRVQGIHFSSTRRLISKLARLTLETGTLTASLSVVSLVLFYVRGLLFDWEVPLSATAKLYSTTLLAILNGRMNLSISPDSMVSWDCADPPAVSTHNTTNADPQQNIGSSNGDHSQNRLIFANTFDTLCTYKESGKGADSAEESQN